MTETRTIGFEEFARDMGKLSEAARKTTALDALEAGAAVIQAYAQDNIRNKLNKRPTGFLANSVTVKRQEKVVHVGVFGVVYAKIHEFGGVIQARGKKTLTFIGDDGKRVFVKKVVMPARPYLRPAVDEHIPEIKEAIGDALRGLLQEAIK